MTMKKSTSKPARRDLQNTPKDEEDEFAYLGLDSIDVPWEPTRVEEPDPWGFGPEYAESEGEYGEPVADDEDDDGDDDDDDEDEDEDEDEDDDLDQHEIRQRERRRIDALLAQALERLRKLGAQSAGSDE
jgi:hypothetical protein